MIPDAITAVYILIALSIWCTGYSIVLHFLKSVYNPDWTWLTVVLGNVWILIGYAQLNLAGFIGWPWLFACMAAAGGPIIIWQQIQKAQRLAGRLARRNKDSAHGTTHPERTADPRSDRRSHESDPAPQWRN